ncbi:MAG: T9SS type A sorting domain-containing protein, partial [Flavipsychrobacter sp.]
GKQVFVDNPVKNNVSVDVSALTQGLYLYRVYLTNNNIVTGKLIKN